MGFQNEVAEFLQWFHRGGAHIEVILHHEDSFARGGFRHRQKLLGIVNRCLREEPRKVCFGGRALPDLGVEPDVPFRLLDEPVDLAQSEPGPSSLRLYRSDALECQKKMPYFLTS